MIIQCRNCKTEFNLDESLIKEGGSKVRCSVCKEIFMAYPPPRSPGEDEFPSLEAAAGFHHADLRDNPVPVEPEEIPDRDDFLDELDVLEDDGSAEEVALDHEDAEFPPEEKKTKKKSSKLRLFSLIILLLLVVAAAVFVYLKPEIIPESLPFLGSEKKQEQADPGVRLLMFSSVSGGFSDAENGGRLFVIRGMVTNKYPKPRSFILIKGSILDDQGKVVKTRTSYAGNSFTEEELKTLPFSDISEAMENRDGMARKNFNVPPGAAIPFMIVFDNLEGSLSEFTVEAVSSSPGT